MIFTASLKVEGDGNLILKCFEPELKVTKKDRAGYTIKKTKKGVEFKISAADSTALRISLNSISKLLNVLEKSGKI
ncbi:MAG: hypothetical protein GY861_09510 [bacterium]|nr:hypothetical protein [bacterium]